MDEQRRGPADLPTSERIATLASAVSNAMNHKAQGEHETQLSASLSQTEAIIASSPDAPQNGRVR